MQPRQNPTVHHKEWPPCPRRYLINLVNIIEIHFFLIFHLTGLSSPFLTENSKWGTSVTLHPPNIFAYNFRREKAQNVKSTAPFGTNKAPFKELFFFFFARGGFPLGPQDSGPLSYPSFKFIWGYLGVQPPY